MTIYNGYTYELSREQIEANRAETLAAIERDRAWFESIQDEPRCCCFEIAGDNPDCPIHGDKS